MPQSTQQFDGATIEEALTKVREAVGTGARIVGAEKVRSGGVAGFFAKERVEVTVELDARPGPVTVTAPTPTPTPTFVAPATPPRATGPVSLLDLADSVSDAEFTHSEPVS